MNEAEQIIAQCRAIAEQEYPGSPQLQHDALVGIYIFH